MSQIFWWRAPIEEVMADDAGRIRDGMAGDRDDDRKGRVWVRGCASAEKMEEGMARNGEGFIDVAARGGVAEEALVRIWDAAGQSSLQNTYEDCGEYDAGTALLMPATRTAVLGRNAALLAAGGSTRRPSRSDPATRLPQTLPASETHPGLD